MLESSYRPQVELLRPQHAGLRMSLDEFEQAQGEEGYRYELIEGVLEVSPTPNPPEKLISVAVRDVLRDARSSSGKPVFAKVVWETRVFVSVAQRRATVSEPDIAAYQTFPPKRIESWREVMPALVIEIVAPGGVERDYVRNREIYQRAPEILEYWIIDPTEDWSRPTMTVHHRADGSQPFERLDIVPGGVYEPVRWADVRIDLHKIAAE